MAIVPLPQFEADLAEHEAQQRLEQAARDAAPKTMVVRFGFMKMIGEFPYSGEIRPGCGSKIVVRTFRGVEIGEMLTSTCPNSGCSKSVSRKEMLQYIENSGGRDYPFTNRGEAIRVATQEDMDAQAKLEQSKHDLKMRARLAAEHSRAPLKIVEVEPILGGEVTTVYYASEDRLDTGALAREIANQFGPEHARVECKHVGARDEARLTADYERCGQYCCCKNFLKVLKPISMRAAKVQKATLDPLKISGRCGRLMCCLRYEDQTYTDLRKNLPNRKKRVGTPDGDGVVLSSQILTQLVLVEIETTGRRIAVPVEDLTEPAGPPGSRIEPPARRGRPVAGKTDDKPDTRSGTGRDARDRSDRSDRPDRSGRADRPARPERASSRPSDRDDDIPSLEDLAGDPIEAPRRDATRDDAHETDSATSPARKKRKRKRKRKPGERSEQQARPEDAQDGGPGEMPGLNASPNADPGAGPDAGPRDEPSGEQPQGAARKKRRRRKRKPRGPGSDGPNGDGPSGDAPSGDSQPGEAPRPGDS